MTSFRNFKQKLEKRTVVYSFVTEMNESITNKIYSIPANHLIFSPFSETNKARNLIEATKSLNGIYHNIVYVTFSDLVEDSQKILDQYNGTDYQFDSIKVLSIEETAPVIKKEDNVLREKYVSGELFTEGDIVQHKSGELYEVLDLRPNYVHAVNQNGDSIRIWIKDIVRANDLREEFYKNTKKNGTANQFVFKGYKTKHFTEEVKNLFTELKKTTKDPFALLAAVQCTDRYLGSDNIEESKIDFERSGKILSSMKVLQEHSYRNPFEDKYIECALFENFQYKSHNNAKIDGLIEMVRSSNSANAVILEQRLLKMKV